MLHYGAEGNYYPVVANTNPEEILDSSFPPCLEEVYINTEKPLTTQFLRGAKKLARTEKQYNSYTTAIYSTAAFMRRRILNLSSQPGLETCLDRGQHLLEDQTMHKTWRMEVRVTFLGTQIKEGFGSYHGFIKSKSCLTKLIAFFDD